MRPESIPRHAYLDNNSQHSCGRLSRDLFAASAAKCLSMLPVHLKQFAADMFSGEQTLRVPSGASSHCFTLATFCFVVVGVSAQGDTRCFRAIALQTTFKGCQRSLTDTPPFFVSLALLSKSRRWLKAFSFLARRQEELEGAECRCCLMDFGHQGAGLHDWRGQTGHR